jgi:hypothetical protein
MFGPEYYTRNQFMVINDEYYCPDCRNEDMIIQAVHDGEENFYTIGPGYECGWQEIPRCANCGKKTDICSVIYPDYEQVDMEEVMEIKVGDKGLGSEEFLLCEHCGQPHGR